MTIRSIDSEHIMQIRREYNRDGLQEKLMADNPIEQFDRWFTIAVDEGFTDPNAMTLATVDEKHRPSARIVLLKDYDNRGFVFYTNYESRKGIDIQQNSYVAMVFYWAELERQVRIEGMAEKVSKEESEEYFHSRPYESQIGAWASHQSEEIQGREDLERRFEEMNTAYKKGEVPLPDFWGGYRVIPDQIEFWQGRPRRLHDRIIYYKKKDDWVKSRLAP
jgi:pyridoxamine 5'-phosphate oxidase